MLQDPGQEHRADLGYQDATEAGPGLMEPPDSFVSGTKFMGPGMSHFPPALRALSKEGRGQVVGGGDRQS